MAEREMEWLEAEKQRLFNEIRNYPTPIAGCDQQFNYLLEEQARVAAELNRLRSQRGPGSETESSPPRHGEQQEEGKRKVEDKQTSG